MRRLLILLVHTLPGVCLGQETVLEEIDPPEEITVSGQASLHSLLDDAEKALDDLYSLFNEVNDDNRFDISCRREKVVGSLIAVRICQANHERDAYAQSAQTSFRGGVYDPRPDMVNKNRILADKMVALINSNPELRKALDDYAEARRAYLSAITEADAGD
ncbi:MAG TPA: hypothetical protein VIM81_06135 [Gammaproteobacteria bacterium]